jgi:hypothetical protein
MTIVFNQQIFEKNLKAFKVSNPPLADIMLSVDISPFSIIGNEEEYLITHEEAEGAWVFPRKGDNSRIREAVEASIVVLFGLETGETFHEIVRYLSQSPEIKQVMIITRDLMMLTVIAHINDITPIINNKKFRWYLEEPDYFQSFLDESVNEIKEWTRKDTIRSIYSSSTVYDEGYYSEIKLQLHKNFMQTVFGKKKNKTYEENLELLKKNDPHLYNQVINISVIEKSIITTNIDNGLYNIFLSEKNDYYYEETELINSIIKELEECYQYNIHTAIFLGAGLGYELELMAEKLSKTEALILIEKKMDVFHCFLQTADLSCLYSFKTTLLFVDKPEGYINYFICNSRKIEEETNIVIHSKATKIFYLHSRLNSLGELSGYYSAVEEITKALSYIQEAYSFPTEKLLQTRINTIENLENILKYPGIKKLFDSFKGKPAIVVAAGPSLEKNIHMLKELQHKAVIIAVEVVHQLLLDNGVKPHFICLLDNVEVFHEYFLSLKDTEVQGTYLITSPVVSPLTYKYYPGEIVNTCTESLKSFNDLFNIDCGSYNVGTNVGMMCFETANVLGCNPIILTGQDLAYSEDISKTHVEGTIGARDSIEKEIQMRSYKGEQQIYVRGNTTERIRTTTTWNLFIEEYRHHVSNYKGVCVNATEGGAYIEGTEVMTLAAAEERYLKKAFSIETIIAEQVKNSYKDDIYEKKQTFYNTLNKVIEDGKKILKTIEEQIYMYEEYSNILKDIDGNDNDKERPEINTLYNKQIDIVKYLERQFPGSFLACYYQVIKYIYKKYQIEYYAVDNNISWHISRIKTEKLRLTKKFNDDINKTIRIFVNELIKNLINNGGSKDET